MDRAVSERIELLHVEDVASDVVQEAAAAALAKLDALDVTPLQANSSNGQLEVMDNRGDLDLHDPPYERYGIVQAHVDAYGEAIEAVQAVFRARRVGPRSRGVTIAVPEAVWAEAERSGKDLSAT